MKASVNFHLLFLGVLLCALQSLATDSPNYVEGQVLVQFKNQGTTESSAITKAVAQILTENNLTVKRRISHMDGPQNVIYLQLLENKKKTTTELLKALKGNPNIEHLEPNYLYRTSTIPNDPYFDQMWGLQNNGQVIEGQTGTVGYDIKFIEGEKMNRPQAPEVVVAVIDSGVDPNNPDLINQFWTNPNEIPGNGIDDDNNGYEDDVSGYHFEDKTHVLTDISGHGTHVIGTIAAEGNNGIGVIGACPQAKILPLGAGVDLKHLSTVAIIAGLNYVRNLKENGVNIVAVNASFGGPSFSQFTKTAIKNLNDVGVIFCAAAGNSFSNNDTTAVYPNNYDLPNIISVANCDSNYERAITSNYGVKMTDLAAPGSNILSTIRDEDIENIEIVTMAIGTNNYIGGSLQYSGAIPSEGITGKLYDCKIGEAEDVPEEVSGHIALIERGTLYFTQKVANAEAKGAIAVIIYNNVDGETGTWTLDDTKVWLPSISTTKSVGESLVNALPTEISITSDIQAGIAYGYKSGTSMACPLVSAAVAKAALNFPNETVAQRIARILDNVTPASALDGLVATGGVLNMQKIIDTDMDGLPDWWEMDYFSNLDSTSTSDNDQDSYNNLEEFLATSDPTSTGSYFAFKQFKIGKENTPNLTYKTSVGRTYQVEVSESLSPPNWQALGATVKGDGTEKSVKDSVTTKEQPNRFYRIKVSN